MGTHLFFCLNSCLQISNLHFTPCMIVPDTVALLSEINGMIKQEIRTLHEAIDVLQYKQKEYSNIIQSYLTRQSEDEAEIRRLEGVDGAAYYE